MVIALINKSQEIEVVYVQIWEESLDLLASLKMLIE